MKVNWQALLPFLAWSRSVNAETLRADLFAGFTNATIVLPQGVAFATIAGLPPEYGLYSALIPPIIAALFGSSMIMISGPTTAISAVVFSALSGTYALGSPEFIQAALILTLLVGVFQVVLGIAKLGRLVAFVSHSVMVGFMAAAAVLIAISQLGDALGVTLPRGGNVLERVTNILAVLSDINWSAVVISMVTLCAVVGFRILSPRLPSFFLALVLGSLVGFMVADDNAPIRMIGDLPAVFPSFSIPEAPLAEIALLAEGAFAIALIALLEAISIGRAFAYKTQVPFNANQEIMAQGLSNVVGGFFQAYPSSGSFTRSGVNYEGGARTPLSAIFSSIFLALILLLVAPFVSYVPLPAMAGIILYVAYRLIDLKEIRHILTTSRSETFVVTITFSAGIFVNLEFAIYVGVILSLLIFLSKSARPVVAISAPSQGRNRRRFRNAETYNLNECPQIVFARIDGPLYFGSADTIESTFRRLERDRPTQKHFVLGLKGVGDIDLTGADLLVHEAERRRKQGGGLYLITQYPPLLARLRKLEVIDGIGVDNVFLGKGDAAEALIPTVDDDICASCRMRVFLECANRPGADLTEDAAVETAADSFNPDVQPLPVKKTADKFAASEEKEREPAE